MLSSIWLSPGTVPVFVSTVFEDNLMAKKTLKEQVKQIVDLDAEQLPAPETEQTGAPQEITLAKFKKLFKDEIKETTDWLLREDKEGDFPDKKSAKQAALRTVIDNHPEYAVDE
jgi:hypothetical protein